MARTDWYCDDVLPRKLTVERMHEVTPQLHWHLPGAGTNWPELPGAPRRPA